MKRSFITVISSVALILVWGYASPAFASGPSLVTLLMDSLGVTKPQAEGGAGAIFNLAESRLGADDFSQVADAVPEMDELRRAAPESAGVGGMLGGLSTALSGGGETVEGLAGLASSFSQLGLDSAMVDKFIPVVLDYVEKSGGTVVKNLLQSALL